MAVITDENFNRIKKFMSQKPVAKGTTTVADPVHGANYLTVDKEVYEITKEDVKIFDNLQVITESGTTAKKEYSIYTPTRQMRDCCVLAQTRVKEEKKKEREEQKAVKAAKAAATPVVTNTSKPVKKNTK